MLNKRKGNMMSNMLPDLEEEFNFATNPSIVNNLGRCKIRLVLC